MTTQSVVKTVVQRGAYHDSVVLMLAAQELSAREGVLDASVVMGNEVNLALLQRAGLLAEGVGEIGPNDLVIAVRAVDDAEAEAALNHATRLLESQSVARAPQAARRPRSVRTALRTNPGINVAVISVAGKYAAAQAWDALFGGCHVLLFSDHVDLADEIALKRYATEHGLLLMGPGAGTAILNGVGFGFANAVPRGPVGIVSAAGTGLQEVSSLIAQAGLGVSQAIGTGGRDVSEAVGGATMLQGMRALQDDSDTKVVVVVSKVASRPVIERVVEQAAASDKLTILALMGAARDFTLPGNAIQVPTLREAAALAAAYVRGESPVAVQERLEAEEREAASRVEALKAGIHPARRYVRGLFSGGTLCEEAMYLWSQRLPRVWSNAPIEAARRLADPLESREHCAIDLGEEEFTTGRPHPMIDNRLRIDRMLQEARDPETAVIVLDVVLGYGAHPDPASELGPAIAEALDISASPEGGLLVVASVTGTDADPQNLSRQRRALEKAGALVMPSNAIAALAAVHAVEENNRQET